MQIEIQLTNGPIAEKIPPPPQLGALGAWVEFRGVVRGEEHGQAISALEYEAYPEMAEREMRRLFEALALKHPCLAARLIHRLGKVPVGEAAIYVGVAGRHRGEALALLGEFMDRLKQDVPIWKRRALAVERTTPVKSHPPEKTAALSIDAALAKIQSHCQPLPAVNVLLEESYGRVLRETVCAPEDLPACDRSTRDGYAILAEDQAEVFQVVDTLHAADWKPRQLKAGQAVRVATGASLPCENLRVVMQEDVVRNGDTIQIIKPDDGPNVRKRGEDVKAGQPLVPSGVRLDAGRLALLATAGCVQPLVGPRLRIVHFTTGDEIVPPGQTPRPGQIRDSNSILIRGLLQKFSCELEQKHLPENFDLAWQKIDPASLRNADLILVSGGASVGDKDFTRPLLEKLGFEIIFSQVNVRPGKPLIFGMDGRRVAFGLPGNPLAHFVCFHLFVASALARLGGEVSSKFLRGQLAAPLLDEPCPRETLWPARWDVEGLHPLTWASSGDVTCLAQANALVRVPANQGSILAGAEVDFWPATAMMTT